MNTRNTRHAFTLIELLVVISIMAVVMALSLPALAKARESGRQLRCSTNLKQVISAVGMHANSNKDRIVYPNWEMPAYTEAGWLYAPPETSVDTDWTPEKRRTGALWQYIECEPVYRCPTDIGPFERTHRITSYLFNGAVAGFPTTVRDIKRYTMDRFRPDGIVGFEHGGRDWNDGASQADEIKNFRHDDGTVVMCFDGRVEWLPERVALEMLFAGGASRLWCQPDHPIGGSRGPGG